MSNYEVSLVKRFFSEFFLVGILLMILNSLEGEYLIHANECDNSLFIVVGIVVIFGVSLFNPIAYFVDYKISFSDRSRFIVLGKMTLRNFPRTIGLVYFLFLNVCLSSPLTEGVGAGVQGDRVYFWIFTMYIIDKLGAFRFSGKTLLDQFLNASYSRW